LEKIWSEEIFGASKSIFYRHQVFVRHATPMETRHFSKVLYNSTQEFLYVALGLRDYRQFIKSVLHIILRLDYDKNEDDSDQIDVTNASFGHSSNIGANFYGLSCTDLLSLSDDLICRHQAYCQLVISRPGPEAGSQPKPATQSQAMPEPSKQPKAAYGSGFKFGRPLLWPKAPARGLGAA
jgi:hypothetical protein